MLASWLSADRTPCGEIMGGLGTRGSRILRGSRAIQRSRGKVVRHFRGSLTLSVHRGT